MLISIKIIQTILFPNKALTITYFCLPHIFLRNISSSSFLSFLSLESQPHFSRPPRIGLSSPSRALFHPSGLQLPPPLSVLSSLRVFGEGSAFLLSWRHARGRGLGGRFNRRNRFRSKRFAPLHGLRNSFGLSFLVAWQQTRVQRIEVGTRLGRSGELFWPEKHWVVSTLKRRVEFKTLNRL